MSSTVETPSACLASAGMLTATEMPEKILTPTSLKFFTDICEKLFRAAKNLWKKTQKGIKTAHFLSDRFQPVTIAIGLSEVQCC
jgi:hypothetical protein